MQVEGKSGVFLYLVKLVHQDLLVNRWVHVYVEEHLHSVSSVYLVLMHAHERHVCGFLAI